MGGEKIGIFQKILEYSNFLPTSWGYLLWLRRGSSWTSFFGYLEIHIQHAWLMIRKKLSVYFMLFELSAEEKKYLKSIREGTTWFWKIDTTQESHAAHPWIWSCLGQCKKCKVLVIQQLVLWQRVVATFNGYMQGAVLGGDECQPQKAWYCCTCERIQICTTVNFAPRRYAFSICCCSHCWQLHTE